MKHWEGDPLSQVGPIRGYVPPPRGMIEEDVVAVLEARRKTTTRVATTRLCIDEVRTGEVKEKPFDGERYMEMLRRSNAELLRGKKLLLLRQLFAELFPDLTLDGALERCQKDAELDGDLD